MADDSVARSRPTTRPQQLEADPVRRRLSSSADAAPLRAELSPIEATPRATGRASCDAPYVEQRRRRCSHRARTAAAGAAAQHVKTTMRGGGGGGASDRRSSAARARHRPKVTTTRCRRRGRIACGSTSDLCRLRRRSRSFSWGAPAVAAVDARGGRCGGGGSTRMWSQIPTPLRAAARGCSRRSRRRAVPSRARRADREVVATLTVASAVGGKRDERQAVWPLARRCRSAPSEGVTRTDAPPARHDRARA